MKSPLGAACLIAFLLFLADSSPIRAAEPKAGWDKAAAAKALDLRAQAWFDFSGSKRKTATERTTCVSCHTTFYYAMARGRLREALGEKEPGPQESRLIAETGRRVENWEKLEPFYGGEKKEASLGTEAIVDATVLILNDDAHHRPAPTPTTNQAIETLFSLQISDGDEKGSWNWLDFGLEPWETSDAHYQGAAVAAFAIGKLPAAAIKKTDEARIDELRSYLASHYEEQGLHHRTWLLLAASGMNGLLTETRRAALIRDLLAHQRDDGGFRTSDLGPWKWSADKPRASSPHSPNPRGTVLGQSDGYATGLVLFALQKAGLKPGRPEIDRGLAWLRANQAPDGSWPGHSLNKDRDDAQNGGPKIAQRFMSDAGSALAVLALLEAE